MLCCFLMYSWFFVIHFCSGFLGPVICYDTWDHAYVRSDDSSKKSDCLLETKTIFPSTFQEENGNHLVYLLQLMGWWVQGPKLTFLGRRQLATEFFLSRHMKKCGHQKVSYSWRKNACGLLCPQYVCYGKMLKKHGGEPSH